MPGLNQAVKISNGRLETNLSKYDYEKIRHTPALWKHTSHDIIFALVVHYFGGGVPELIICGEP